MKKFKIKCKYVSFDEIEDTLLAIDEHDAYILAKRAFFNMNANQMLKGEDAKVLISVEVEDEEVC